MLIHLLLSIFLTALPNIGNDKGNFSSDNGDGTFTNPVIRGDYPDTDIIRVGNDFYMISSSFSCMPGIPICHSKDLINWKIIGHAYDSLTFLPSYSMEHEITAYGRACWAPTIRYHDGWFYVGVNLKGDRFIMCKSRRPEGPYTMYPFAEELYDPGLFIDDNGRKYVTHGQNDIRITELNEEGTEIKNPGDRGTIILHAPSGYHLYFEGCHTYKRNGWYYIFNPAQGYCGVQMVSRSRNLMGPYETKVFFDNTLNYAGAGIHQGGFVDTAEGESWAFMFQDRDYMGRDMVLFPMQWVNDWPVISQAYVTCRKPAVKAAQPICSPQESDDFCSQFLKPIWEWNHAPINEKWSLEKRKGHLRLYASPAKGFEWARNSLTQKIVGPASTATVKVDVNHLKLNDFAGNGIMGSVMLQQGVMRTAGGYELQIHQSKHKDDETIFRQSLPPHLKTIWLRTHVTKKGNVSFSYSLDGNQYIPVQGETNSGFWRFLGLRYALCCYQHTTAKDSSFYTTDNLRKSASGYADFDSFEIESAYHGNHYDAFAVTDFDLFDRLDGMHLIRPIDYNPQQHLEVEHAGAWASFYNMEFSRSAQKVSFELKSRMSDVIILLHEGDANGPIIASFPIKATGGKWTRQSFKVNIPAGTHSITFTLSGNVDQTLLKSFQFES